MWYLYFIVLLCKNHLNMFKIRMLLFLLISNFSFAQTDLSPVFFVGPMFHYNIGGENNRFSFSLEGSAWVTNSNLPLPPSVNLGIEFERKKVRVYSELQTGALLGLSLGPVIEFSENDPMFGFQSSIWAAFFTGFDMRYRRINKTNIYAPGFFIKAPILFDNLKLGM
jgi:hypothetical protein